jgi:high-affinity Fe2+/Pb2+ permease
MSKKLLGTLSPAYGMMTGHGAFGKLADSGVGGLIPTMLAQQRRKKKDGTEMTAAEEAAAPKEGMKKGGKVKTYAAGGSASKRADGCAQRGKTRGKMV